jgi:hypothetical protein
MTQVSVVIVHWNVPELLRRCLRSVEDEISRSGMDAEIIVVDSASQELGVDEVEAEFTGTRFIRMRQNNGYAAANNVGIQASTGEAVFVLNPDTELLPGALEQLWKASQISSHVGLVAPLLLNTDGSLQSHGYTFPTPRTLLFDFIPVPARLYASRLNGRVPLGDGELPVAIDYALGGAMLIRRAALLEAGCFDERYGMYSEEVDLARKLERLRWTRLLAPKARVIHHGGQSTGQRPEAMREALWRSRALYYRYWGSKRDQLLARAAVSLGTRWQDRTTAPEQRAANARIRRFFTGTMGEFDA